MTGEPLSLWLEIIVSAFLLLGSAFVLIGAIGLYRLRDFFMRLHGPTKATTLGVGGVIVASLIYFSNRQAGISLHELLISLFLFISAPVSAYMLAKAAVLQQLPLEKKTRGKPWEQ
ncbi:Na+/H+ antiporter subunit G [Pseudomonas aeruginosa]|uniref:Monovalent cation/H+ antiporter subunit G n=2 Tax=Pseudomonas TaxID=286 RepID=A0A448BPQ4_PSEFL|nr:MULTISPECIES: Na+/H+ antiporter subunit G [Pseudomonas]KEA28831.1 monovalent cation/H+ antiporter subunit G [Pseudomonas aeruginosa C0324C]VEE47295.1 monovalent cation/H+ antiporter subunit G [Pseudomonas fluorescens]HCL2631224.1 Na+/H+ antiporter subunit G [Pseudomonas aeruginosa 3C2A]HCL2788570.1 Na+/H+ antiporter subunit G [Pseudomonas aeruginosa 1BAE]ALY62528.1 Na+/H+ antiporter subunit G [Pseudomonas aeruginosa]